jgi:DNA-binding transcriptional MerR regulator
MQVNLTIGEFSRMTHLSVKTLRHYHRVGLLAPTDVDPDTGYRFYSTGQVPTAQIIRRFRDLEMPVEQLRAVLAAPDPDTRNALILKHLASMEDQLHQTQDAVAALRALLTRPDDAVPVEYHALPATSALAISGTVGADDLGPWWAAAFAEVQAAMVVSDVSATGPVSGQFATELFELERGDAMLFIPTSAPPTGTGRARPVELPAVELAVAVHRGSHADVDRTYGALGTHVAEHALGVAGPLRETYVVNRLDTADATRWRTQIGWPIFRTVAH